MTDCGPLDEDTRETLFRVPDDRDRERTVEDIESQADDAPDHFVTPGNDPLDSVGDVEADEDEVVQDVLQRMRGGDGQ